MCAYEVIEHPNDPGLAFKKTNPVTEKLVMFTRFNGIGLERCVKAARELSAIQLEKKMRLGISEIDTTICVSYMGKMFSVDSKMSMDEAKENYLSQVRQDRIKKLGMRLVP